jgi:hypothetical protein
VLNCEIVTLRLDRESMRDLMLIAQTTERSKSAVMRLLIKNAASKMGITPTTEQLPEAKPVARYQLNQTQI